MLLNNPALLCVVGVGRTHVDTKQDLCNCTVNVLKIYSDIKVYERIMAPQSMFKDYLRLPCIN